MTNDVRLVGDEDDRKVFGDVHRGEVVEEIAGTVIRLTVNDRVDDDESIRA